MGLSGACFPGIEQEFPEMEELKRREDIHDKRLVQDEEL